MSAPPSVEFRGTEEELDKYLVEFARATGGWIGREKNSGLRVVAGGAALSTNPNTLPWQVRVVRENGNVTLRAQGWRAPWTRAKGARLASYRVGQLADFLETRLRGGGPEKFDALRLREPFATWGSDPAAMTASFAWTAACAVGALAAALVACTIASCVLMGITIDDIRAHARAVEAAGDLPLPRPEELDAIGFGFTLRCAVMFAFPIAFFLGLLHAAALAVGEAWTRGSIMGQGSFLVQAIFIGFAFVPVMPFYASLPAALLIPLAIHAGYAIVWGRRRERVREGPRPRRAMVAAGLLLAAFAGLLMLPTFASGHDLTDQLALFRDRYLLGHPLGKAAATFYYRHTLYAAWPLKQFYSDDAGLPERSQRTASVYLEMPSRPDPELARWFRELDFSVIEKPSTRTDVVSAGREDLASGENQVSWDRKSGSQGLKRAVNELAGKSFRGGSLRDLNAIAWRAVYYGGPLFLLALFIAACCPGMSVIFRVLPRRAAILAVGVCFLSTAGFILLDLSRHGDARAMIRTLRENPTPGQVVAALDHEAPEVRHEAAYRSWKKTNAGHAEGLLRAADDPDFRVRLWACAALGKTGDPRALPKLLARLSDTELFVRYRAAEGLGLLGHPAAEPALVGMMKKGIWYEGLYALEALRRILPDQY
jgi:hypothetical protein